MRKHFTLASDHLTSGRVHTLVTSVFSHNELNRLIAGTAALFVVSAPVVAVLGQPRFAALYLAGGLASAMAGLAIAPAVATGTAPASKHRKR